MKYDASHLQNKQDEKRKLRERKQKLSPHTKRILIVDDDSDITFTFKKAFEEANRNDGLELSPQPVWDERT